MLPVRAAEGKIKESRGGPLDEAGVRAIVSPKEEGKEREMGGVRYGDEARESGADRMLEKEQRTVHKDGEHCTMPRPRKNGMLPIPTQTAFVGHAAK